MSLNLIKLKSICTQVLREHIGVSAYVVTEEAIDAYLQMASPKKSAMPAEFIPHLFFAQLNQLLPASLPLKDIELTICFHYRQKEIDPS